MLIENQFDVSASVEQVWNYLLDVPRMAPCMPGAELTEVVDNDTYKGRVTTKLGPVSMRFSGIAHIVERDEANKRIVLDAEGAEEKGKGQASMAVTATLVPSSSGGTTVKVSQDLTVSGAAAQYGRGMIQDVSTVILKQFAANMQEDIGRASRGEARSGAPKAAKGFTIGMQATLLALKRFFRKLFGGGKGGE